MATTEKAERREAQIHSQRRLINRSGAVEWLAGWWCIIHLGARVLALVLSPSSYTPAYCKSLLSRIYLATAPLLLWFTVLSSLISLVVIRIVVVTAQSYGLSQYALQMVVRVLVLELIPLTAAVFVALRVALPDSGELAALRARGQADERGPPGAEAIAWEVAPRVMASAFAVLALAAVSGVVTLVLAYVSVYGFVSGGLEQYTRTVGHVFHPAVTLVFVLKTLFLSLAVALIPAGSALYDSPEQRSRSNAEIRVLVRLFLVILLIEAVSLVGNYY
jgi:phospholipid/cholesterol/gamma-HCH transport system permease protein